MLIRKRNHTATKVTFLLPFDDPDDEVCVVGDFNDWQPGAHPLTRSTYGTRAVTLTLPLDHRYLFSYLTGSGHRFADPDIGQATGPGNVLTT